MSTRSIWHKTTTNKKLVDASFADEKAPIKFQIEVLYRDSAKVVLLMNVRNKKIKELKKKSALPNTKQPKSKKLKNENLFPKTSFE